MVAKKCVQLFIFEPTGRQCVDFYYLCAQQGHRRVFDEEESTVAWPPQQS